MASPPNNPWLHRSSVSVPRERRTTWQMIRLAFECVLIAGLLIAIAVTAYNIYQRVLQQNLFPLKRVIIREPLRYGDMGEVSEIIRNHHQRDLMHMDVALLADEMQRLDWIAKASVYKRWPDAVEVELEERVPVVRWGGSAYLDAAGEPFSIPDNDKLRQLFTLHGPDGYEKQVLQYYQLIAPWLASQHLEIKELLLDQRLIWHARLDNGLDVILGRDQLNERLKKLAVVNAKVIEPYQRYIDAIDLRYHDGFSVRWKPGVKPVTAEKNTARSGQPNVTMIRNETAEAPAAEKPPAKEAAKAVVKNKPVAKDNKTATKPAVADKTPAKEKAATTEKIPPKETKEKTVAKTAPAEKPAAKEAKEKPAATEKTPAKENKEKTAAKPAAAEKAPAKENKEKTTVKTAPAEKTPAKEVKEKTATKTAPAEKTPAKENKEKTVAKTTPAEKTPAKESKEKTAAKPAPAAKTAPKDIKEKTAAKPASASKPAPKEKEPGTAKK